MCSRIDRHTHRHTHTHTRSLQYFAGEVINQLIAAVYRSLVIILSLGLLNWSSFPELYTMPGLSKANFLDL